MARPVRRSRGFTLIELLVAITIMALLSVGAFNFLSGTSRTADRLNARQADLLAIERMQSVIANDLAQWVDRPIRDELGDALPPFVLSPDGALEFTRRGLSNPLDKPRSDMLRVRYELRGKQLWRLTWLTLDRLPGLKPVESPIGPELERLRWRARGSNVSRIEEVWPPTSSGATGISGAVLNQGAPAVLNLEFDAPPYGEIRRIYLLPDNDNATG
ncbi:general secretion pathway protein J [Paraperlucidibaca baekdonensis]|uniref:Type II secretion system protein J n=1 Tax=Paraperlucidibaca baekdonensis TaxID=748120 RepID=A0A3E0H199_9GAMM|nr:general secretion pathway protein J [Paraperlucidibaca baekdonensis]